MDFKHLSYTDLLTCLGFLPKLNLNTAIRTFLKGHYMKLGEERNFKNKMLLLPAERILTSSLLLSNNSNRDKIKKLFNLYAKNEVVT